MVRSPLGMVGDYLLTWFTCTLLVDNAKELVDRICERMVGSEGCIFLISAGGVHKAKNRVNRE